MLKQQLSRNREESEQLISSLKKEASEAQNMKKEAFEEFTKVKNDLKTIEI